MIILYLKYEIKVIVSSPSVIVRAHVKWSANRQSKANILIVLVRFAGLHNSRINSRRTSNNINNSSTDRWTVSCHPCNLRRRLSFSGTLTAKCILMRWKAKKKKITIYKWFATDAGACQFDDSNIIRYVCIVYVENPLFNDSEFFAIFFQYSPNSI